MFPHRNWTRHTATVPKGFIRYHVLEALSEKPMSGSELMDQIEKHTDSVWKPSPGSIYPLLAWLQEKNYIKELPTENGLKRYELTASGKVLLEEETKIREKMRQDAGFMSNPFFDRLFEKIPREKARLIRASMKRLFISSMKLRKTLQENYSDETLSEALRIINETSDKLEALTNKTKGEQDE